MKKYIIASLAIVSAITFQSCSSDDDNGSVDTEKPVIVLNEPTDHEAFLPGSEIHLDADFSDNVELGSYKIEIHSAADGHEHKGANAVGEWFYSETNQIEAGLRNTHIHKHIAVPTTVDGLPIVEGHYHLGIFLTDKAGNEQQHFIEIVVGEDHDH
ncbi:DUF4625 domain-containing protein [Moheibacter sediminis]|uniref:DUF4625 domain-containing protein n=1 Tax=Moheibacter sediminis TaxID=1434700 RepID=A0A1W1Z165_9FLAO|nr:DUF4625 domain-containing protein [Moheibacter sediminis]SMC41821.1 protein of unknown function [Moheibacter sediminis]